MGLNSLLGSAMSLNWVQLDSVRSMGIRNQGSGDIILRDGEPWSDTEDIYRVDNSSKGLAINNATNVVVSIGDFWKLGEILEDIRLTLYESWEEMEQY